MSNVRRAGKGVREHTLGFPMPSRITTDWHSVRLQTQSPLPPSSRLLAGLQRGKDQAFEETDVWSKSIEIGKHLADVPYIQQAIWA